MPKRLQTLKHMNSFCAVTSTSSLSVTSCETRITGWNCCSVSQNLL